MGINLLIIDNAIAGGKSTLINKLISTHPSWFLINEGVPIDEKDIINIKNCDDFTLLQDLIAFNIYNDYNETFKNIIVKDCTIIADRIWCSYFYWQKYYTQATTRTQVLIAKKIKEMLISEKVKVYYVFLSAPVDFILKNIKDRNRDFEQNYDETNVKKLIEIYQPFQDLQGLEHKIKVFYIDNEFYKNEVNLIEKFLNEE